MSLRSSAALVRCCAAARFPLRSHPPTFSPPRCDASGEGPGLRRNSPGTLSLRFLRCAVDLPVSAAVPQRPPRSAPTLPHFPVRALPALLCRSAGICRALPAPLRRFGRGPRSQKKFARDPLPPLYSAALVSVSVFPAPLRRSRIFPSEPFPLCSAALLVSVEPFPLHFGASEQGSSLRQIRSEPCPSAFSAARLIFPFQLYFLRPGSSSFGAGGCWHNVVPARK